MDWEDNELFASGELEDGVFLTYNNNCDWDEVTETIFNQDIQVYPNPTNGMLNIEGQDAMRISVSNLLGQKLQETTSEGSTSIDMSLYDAGIYVVIIETKHGVAVHKVNLSK